MFVLLAALIVATLGNPTVAADECIDAGVRGGPLIRDPLDMVYVNLDGQGETIFEIPTFVVKNAHEMYYVWGVASCMGTGVQEIIDCVQSAGDLLDIRECLP